MSDQQSPSGQTWVCRAPVTVSGRCRPIGNFGPFHDECGPSSSVPYVQDDLYDRMTRSAGSSSPAGEQAESSEADQMRAAWAKACASAWAKACASLSPSAPSTPVDEAEQAAWIDLLVCQRCKGPLAQTEALGGRVVTSSSSPSTPGGPPSAVVRSAEGRAAGTHVPGASRAMKEMAVTAQRQAANPAPGGGTRQRPGGDMLACCATCEGTAAWYCTDPTHDHQRTVRSYTDPTVEATFWKRTPDRWTVDVRDVTGKTILSIPAIGPDDPDALSLATQLADSLRWTPAPPVPLTRPDTDELRATAHFVCDDIDNGRGDDASDLILAAADWIDAQPAPLTPTPQPDGRWVEAIWHILVTEGGANAEDRDAFIAQWPDCVEYRFGGHLGSGGKVWAPGSKRSVPVVDFYPESSTVSRRAIAARINVHLCDAYVMAIALGSAAPPPTPVERPAAITDEMLRAAETHHGDSCSYCTSAGDIDCPTAAVLDALAAATSPAPGDNP